VSNPNSVQLVRYVIRNGLVIREATGEVVRPLIPEPKATAWQRACERRSAGDPPPDMPHTQERVQAAPRPLPVFRTVWGTCNDCGRVDAPHEEGEL